IVSLLSEPEPDIAASMRQKLYDLGESVVREIHCACEEGSRAHREVSRVLMRFKEPSLDMRFRNLALNELGDIALEEGVFALARFGYPDLDESAYKTRLGHMAFELAPRVAPDDHPIRIIRTLNHFLFEEKGFYAPRHYDPDDTYLNRVLDRKRGWPITISTVYLILAQRLELPIVGVGLPDHYIVKYTNNDRDIFIDPYNRGQILTANECAELIGATISDDLFHAATNRFTLFRMMSNLKNTYLGLDNQNRAKKLESLISIIQADLTDF
ncbi:MAG: transglutaminase-like domain-containing protein, partial [Candidatus Latescibacteria bacterium]|nr:transglutaminase-like domain-containing protein [Candidatus Latescibacterota bacterium]